MIFGIAFDVVKLGLVVALAYALLTVYVDDPAKPLLEQSLPVVSAPGIQRVRLSEYEVVSCRLNEGLAKELGQRLYADVGLKGQATWDAKDHSLVYFRVEEILPYEYIGAVQAAYALNDASRGAYDAVKDVQGFIRGLREEDEK